MLLRPPLPRAPTWLNRQPGLHLAASSPATSKLDKYEDNQLDSHVTGKQYFFKRARETCYTQFSFTHDSVGLFVAVEPKRFGLFMFYQHHAKYIRPDNRHMVLGVRFYLRHVEKVSIITVMIMIDNIRRTTYLAHILVIL